MHSPQRAFYERTDVLLRLNTGEREPEYAPIYKADGKIGPGAKENPTDPELSLLIARARAEGREPAEEEACAVEEQSLPAEAREVICYS